MPLLCMHAVYGWLQAEFQAVESLERFTLTIGAIKGEIKEQLAFTVGHTDGTAGMCFRACITCI